MKHQDFDAAKRRGDAEAAGRLVASLADPESFKGLADRYAGARIACVGGAEAANQIPLAFARYLSQQTGMRLDTGVLKANSPKHTGKSAIQRFVARACFDGRITTGANYIAVDDVMTQGGTISEFRQFLQRQGSRVVAVATLAFTSSTVMSDGLHIATTLESRRSLMGRFGLSTLSAVLRDFGIYEGNVFALTESEARLVLRYATVDDLRAALAEAFTAQSTTELAPVGCLPPLPSAGARKPTFSR